MYKTESYKKLDYIQAMMTSLGVPIIDDDILEMAKRMVTVNRA